MKTVSVTGNLGYIGSILTPMVIKNGFGVIGYVSTLYRKMGAYGLTKDDFLNARYHTLDFYRKLIANQIIDKNLNWLI